MGGRCGPGACGAVAPEGAACAVDQTSSAGLVVDRSDDRFGGCNLRCHSAIPTVRGRRQDEGLQVSNWPGHCACVVYRGKDCVPVIFPGAASTSSEIHTSL